MVRVKVTIRRLLDDEYPGWVEAVLIDACGREWLFIDKAPIFDHEVDRLGKLPRSGVIRCELVASPKGSDALQSVDIDTESPDRVESTTGETRFTVHLDQLELSE